MIIHLGTIVHKLWQKMTRQKHGSFFLSFSIYCQTLFRVLSAGVLSLHWISFVTGDICGCREVRDNKTNPKVSLLAGLFFMLLLSSSDFSKLTFNNRLSGTQSKIDPDQYRRSRSWSWSKLFAKVISRRPKWFEPVSRLRLSPEAA